MRELGSLAMVEFHHPRAPDVDRAQELEHRKSEHEDRVKRDLQLKSIPQQRIDADNFVPNKRIQNSHGLFVFSNRTASSSAVHCDY